MDIRDSFSRLKKKLKDRGTPGKRKQDRIGVVRVDSGEGVDPADSLSRPVPHVAVGGGHYKEGGEASNVDGREMSQRRHLRSDVEVAVGSGLGREGRLNGM